MKLLLKISLALVSLLLIAVIGFVLLFDPNDYKEELINIAKDKTGRELSIPGDISLSLFPWIGLDLGAIEISNAKGFGKKPFAKMSHLQVRAKFWPLFKKRLEADTIVIEGLKLNLVRNKHGITNYDDFIKGSTQSEVSTKTTNKKAKDNGIDKGKNILATFALNGIKIKNAQFDWHDQQLKQKISVKDVQLKIGKLIPETKIPFNMQFHLQEKSLDAKINFKSKIVFSPNFKVFSFYNTQLKSDLKLASLKNRLSPQLNSALMQLNLEQQTFNTKELNLSEKTLKLQTKISATKLFSTPAINSQIIIHPFNPRAFAKDLEIQLPDMANDKALTKLNAQLNIQGTLKNIGLTNLELSLDNTNIIGNAKVNSVTGASNVNLVLDNINLDHYLPKVSKEKPKTSKKIKTKNSSDAALIPIALLSMVNVDAKLKIKKLQIKNTYWNNFKVNAHSKNGLINIMPLAIQGYDSKIKSNFTINVLKNTARVSGNLNIQNINAGKLLNDFTGKDKLKGQTSIEASFNTSGIKLSQLKKNLNGKLKLHLKNGTLKGFDLEHQKDVLEAKVKRKAIPPAPQPVETKIANLSASAIIKKGILSNKDLRASTPLSRIAGRGTVDIAKEKLNYVASVKFTSSRKIKANKPYEKMNAVPLDIHIKGTFEKPIIDVQFKKALSQLLKKEIKKQKKKITEKTKKDLKKKIEKKLGDKLKKLFKF